jgi:hypothetical protein
VCCGSVNLDRTHDAAAILSRVMGVIPVICLVRFTLELSIFPRRVLSYQEVPYCVATKLYFLEPPGGMGHSVTPGTPSLTLFSCNLIPCQ